MGDTDELATLTPRNEATYRVQDTGAVWTAYEHDNSAV